jgi:hypothetical protein
MKTVTKQSPEAQSATAKTAKKRTANKRSSTKTLRRGLAWTTLVLTVSVAAYSASTLRADQPKAAHMAGEMPITDQPANELALTTSVSGRSGEDGSAIGSSSVAGSSVEASAAPNGGLAAGSSVAPAVNDQWLPSPLHIVSVNKQDATVQQHKLVAAGFGVVLLDPSNLASEAKVHRGETWWITNAAAKQVSSAVAQEVMNGGGRLLLDGYSELAASLLELAPIAGTVDNVSMFGEALYWDEPGPQYKPKIPFTSLVKTSSGTPVLLQSGKILWSLPLLSGEKGVEKFPFLPQILGREFGLLPRAAANETELYVDPDLEHGARPDELAQRWKNAGIRRVHVAGWKDDVLKKQRYNYAAFVDAMHLEGIEVFAWLEWPHINFSFWDAHPECKEITGSGKAAMIFWREHVALYLERCFDFAFEETKNVLASASFDGINVAELTFESPGQGPDDPAEYTPFHPELRKRFAALTGVDPLELVNPASPHFWKNSPADFAAWNRYRVKLIADLHQKLLARLRTIPAGRQLMVTIFEDRSPLADSSPAPSTHPLGENTGSSTASIAKLRSEGPFELQIEDPFTVWMMDPERYLTYPALYPEVPTDQLVLDINVVDRTYAKSAGRVTSRTTGFEFYRSVAAVGRSGAQLALYASATVNPEDLQWARYALAAGALDLVELGNGAFDATATRPIHLQLIRPAMTITLDGKATALSGQREILIPIGKHHFTLA